MPTQTAKKRFIPNTPVKAGVLYKAVINGKDYIVKAKYNKILSEFNAMWFTNEAPKQYFFRRSEFSSFTGVLMPSDEIIVDGESYINDNIGALSNEELNVLFDTYVEERLVSGLYLSGDEDYRTHKINIRPFVNLNAEELKYFSFYSAVRTLGVRIFKVVKPQEIVFEVTEVFIPILPGVSNAHSLIVNFTGFTVTYQETLPTSTTAITATYSIPNELTYRKLTVIPNGDTALILKFE